MIIKEISYGIIPLRRWQGKLQVLLIKHNKGHWAFPKGHPEGGEDPIDTAQREFKEETSLRVVSFLQLLPFEERYFFQRGPDLIDKTAIYFAAMVDGKVILQEAEISDSKWLSLEEVQEYATFPEAKSLCLKITTLITD